jgi:hypothetical protein
MKQCMIVDNRHSWQLTRKKNVKQIYICVFCWVVPARLEERPTLQPVCGLSKRTRCILVVIHMTVTVNMEMYVCKPEAANTV